MSVVLEPEGNVETNMEEIEGFMIVKTILGQKIKLTRISFRHTQSYFAIFLDDNNRKTICRHCLNGKKKHLALMNENKKAIKKKINTVDDIFESAEGLIKVVMWYTGERKGWPILFYPNRLILMSVTVGLTARSWRSFA